MTATPAPSDTTTAATAEPAVKKRETLASIQVMRGFAALAVVVYHTHLILSQSEYGGIDVLGWFAGKGWIGVNFFFVLSGFIIPFAHHQDIGRPERAKRYISRRFTRVYPVYWIFATLYLIAAAVGFGHADFEWDPLKLLSGYTLVKFVEWPSMPLKVAWTLFYEIFFYAAFLLLILNRTIGSIIVGLWVAVITIWGVVLNHDAPTWYVHTWNLYFVVGALGYLAYRKFDGHDGRLLLLFGLALLILMGATGYIGDHIAIAQTYPRHVLLLSLPFVMILVGGALTDRLHGWRPPAILALLGDASYVLYLVHSPAISVMAIINHKLAKHIIIPPHLLYFIVIVGATIAGIIAHLIVEKPLLKWMRRLTESKAQRQARMVEQA